MVRVLTQAFQQIVGMWSGRKFTIFIGDQIENSEPFGGCGSVFLHLFYQPISSTSLGKSKIRPSELGFKPSWSVPSLCAWGGGHLNRLIRRRLSCRDGAGHSARGTSTLPLSQLLSFSLWFSLSLSWKFCRAPSLLGTFFPAPFDLFPRAIFGL